MARCLWFLVSSRWGKRPWLKWTWAAYIPSGAAVISHCQEPIRMIGRPTGNTQVRLVTFGSPKGSVVYTLRS
jgi:hypothetical protein